ncbi:hypothetical protein PaG_05548 [Moesziomyces aphidis]|uniref:Alpha/beta hydrolase n=1 Tax=Moesziomyces aphidis TaxID=84754 RepID=W3VFC6_MOEAP|nr:hypothetical protein PaG_05548 [Moesziomyces aphidis]
MWPLGVPQLVLDPPLDLAPPAGSRLAMLSWAGGRELAMFLDSQRDKGVERDGASAWLDMASARAQLSPEQAATTLIVAPQFLNGLDKDKFCQCRPLVWKANTWGEGAPSQGRKDSGPSGVSSFEALDALVAHFSSYASLRKITLSGHSLGAQLVQRYSVLGRPHKEITLGTEPGDTVDAQDMDMYKYGLEGVDLALSCYGAVGDRTMHARRWLAERVVHFLHAEHDRGVGDDRPPALAQGANRLERAQHYRAHLDALAKQAGLPPKWTVDWIPHATHDGLAM